MSSIEPRPTGLLVAETHTRRSSKLFPGVRLVHGDLHNHTLLSDGAGDPRLAFESMRRAGLDVAAITDHALYAGAEPLPEAERLRHNWVRSLTDAGWRQVSAVADQFQEDGVFVALGGFEWTSPHLGHMNVWFSANWTDSVSTGGYQADHPAVASLPRAVHPLVQTHGPSENALHPMERFYEWLQRPVENGGGLDGLVGFNHPGREPERFGQFVAEPRLQQRIVSLEMFNRADDYLVRGVDDGLPSPLADCLDHGWQVGLIGVSDDHSDHWGFTPGYGRTGMWVRELTREGVREALLARRVFATRERGLLLDAAANGVRMGGHLSHPGGAVRIVVDIDPGTAWWGKPLEVQVLTQGAVTPAIKWTAPVIVPRQDQPPIQFDVPLEADETRWIVLRITDPRSAAPSGLSEYGSALAYASPFFVHPV